MDAIKSGHIDSLVAAGPLQTQLTDEPLRKPQPDTVDLHDALGTEQQAKRLTDVIRGVPARLYGYQLNSTHV